MFVIFINNAMVVLMQVPYYEWWEFGFNMMDEMKAYLAEKLKK